MDGVIARAETGDWGITKLPDIGDITLSNGDVITHAELAEWEREDDAADAAADGGG